MENFINDFIYYSEKLIDTHSFIVPLGAIGVWRWLVWLFKEIVALKYRPDKRQYSSSVSVITPVYNENPAIFSKALFSWKKNNPSEIIAVIDRTDKSCIEVFKKFSKGFKGTKLIITNIPGKRPSLAKGIKEAGKSEIIALVDSDTIWSKDVVKNGLSPFIDPKVGGVSTYQNVLNPKTFAQKIFDIHLDLRYSDEFPFLAASGPALVCLSGRTAFYRKIAILPLLNDLVNETFRGTPVISGDDKRLTYLVLRNGWKLAFQSNSKVYTPGMKSFSSYLKQRVRWSRNSLRSDLKAMWEGWTWQYPSLAFFQIDKVIQSFVVLLSPIYFIISILLEQWILTGLIFSWWLVSRTIKIFPHLRRRPKDLIIVPFFVPYQFITSIIKIYALFTLNTQGWITRWHKVRLPKIRFVKTARAYVETFVFVGILFLGVFAYRHQIYLEPLERQRELVEKTLSSSDITTEATKPQKLKTDLFVRKYVVQNGDTLAEIAQRFQVDLFDLLETNISRLPNWNRLNSGFVMNIPGKDINLSRSQRFNYQRIYDDPLKIIYDNSTDTVLVSGRGQEITLKDIRDRIGDEYLSETVPKVWDLKSNLFIRSGVTIKLNKDEVNWLRLASNNNKYVMLRAYNGTILVDGVKITSWDKNKNDFDKKLDDGRSFILVKDGSRMDLLNSELAYLGFSRPQNFPYSSYGVSFRMSNGKLGTAVLTGEVINSKFHHNYFGAFTFGATGMVFRGNEFYENVRYGLDPHDDSNGFLVENNKFYNNGSHGLIFSKRCVNNIVRNNYSYNNKLHGIMFHEKSDKNLVENNVLYGNKRDGIALWKSSNNIIRNNIIAKNRDGIRLNMTSNNNVFDKNQISDSERYGVYFYGNSQNNIVSNNNITNNYSGMYIRSSRNQIVKNIFRTNKIGIYMLDKANENGIIENNFTYNRSYGIYAKTKGEMKNFVKNNILVKNRKDSFVRLIDEPGKETKKISFFGK